MNKRWVVGICSVAAFLLLLVMDVGAAYKDYVHVGYQPYKGGDPDNGTNIPAWGSYTYNDVLSDIQLISKHFNQIRTWSIQYSNEHIIPAAHATGIKMAMGAWAFPSNTPPHYFDEAKSKAEIDSIVAQEKQYPGTVTTIICGNENLSDSPSPYGITQANIEMLMAYARSKLDSEGLSTIKVTTCQTAGVWAGHGSLAQSAALDEVWANIYPFWHGNNPDDQAMTSYFEGQYNSVVGIAGGKKVVIGETGWATAGNTTWSGGTCQPGVANAKKYFDAISQWLENNSVEGHIFEMFDEPWKYSASMNQESHFGIFEGWNNNRQKYTIPFITDTPALEIRPGALEAGSRFSLEVVLNQNIDEAFDFYIVADTQFGRYTLYHRGRVEKGIKALYSNVPRYSTAVETTTTNVLPNTTSGVLVTFYTVVVQAGKIPPISNLDQLTENTQYVIMMDSQAVTIQ